MLIISAQKHIESWYQGLPDNWLVGVSESGYSNDQLAYEWLKHFDRFSAYRSKVNRRLLLFDGHNSHCTYEFVTYCNENDIIPFCLPPHTTHLLQPLDVVIFQPYKYHHAQATDDATRTGCTGFSRSEFLHAIQSIRDKTFKSSTIRKGFRQTDLIPYNPQEVLQRLREYSPESTNSAPTSYASSSSLCTPKSLWTMERYARKIPKIPHLNLNGIVA